LITSHRFLEAGLVANASVAFFSLSLCASSVYVVNDLSDLDSDRKHHSKRYRPFASGALSIPVGVVLACALLCGGLLLSLLLPRTTTGVVLGYVMISFAYTLWLKQKLLADVLTLAILYTIRIIVGGTAASILVSPWLLAFSLFLFISLAFSKRVAEMIRVATSSRDGLAGRGYLVADTQIAGSLGATSGYLAGLVLSLYINNDAVHKLYVHPDWLWLLLPLLLYSIGRLWLLTMRGRMSDDPILFVLKDTATYWVLGASALIFLAATKLPFGMPALGE
jgi:4-hydroxybenzoate polyprenyltransferase